MGGEVQRGVGRYIPPLPHNSLISLNSILAIHLFRIDASHRQADVCQ